MYPMTLTFAAMEAARPGSARPAREIATGNSGPIRRPMTATETPIASGVWRSIPVSTATGSNERQGRAEDDGGDHADMRVPEALERFRGQDQRRNGTARDPQKRDSELGVGQAEGILHLGDPWRPTGEDRAVDEEDRPQGGAGETELAVRHEDPRDALPVVVCAGPGRGRSGASSDLGMRIDPGFHKGPSTPTTWTEAVGSMPWRTRIRPATGTGRPWRSIRPAEPEAVLKAESVDRPALDLVASQGRMPGSLSRLVTSLVIAVPLGGLGRPASDIAHHGRDGGGCSDPWRRGAGPCRPRPYARLLLRG